jgi:hypothetical protein
MPVKRPIGAAAAVAAVAAVGLGTASCAQKVDEDEENVFDRATYCEAMHTATPEIDAEGMTQGDSAALEAAGATYERLAGLAPEELAYEWRVIISGMEAMIREARGAEAATEDEAAEFRSAYQTVYSDYIEACVEAPSPGD